MTKPEHIGVVVVHGIGEQRRFEHLDGQVRSIVSALRARHGVKVTVEITGTTGGAFHAEQDSWGSGPTVRVLVDNRRSGKLAHIHFHEVWWADINEPYSLVKQLRFWGWALSVWWYPDKLGSILPTASAVRPPASPNRSKCHAIADKIWTRTRLFGVAFVAVVGATSIGMVTFFAERVLNLRAPNFIRVFVNYVAGVKLYNQKKRWGVGLPAKQQDFLDTLDEPPRVSVRRRMLRTIMDMAEGPQIASIKIPYDRWYVLAHSLGSVAAFNGLMETAYSWPGYFNEDQWTRLRLKGFAGKANPAWPQPSPNDETSPRRPVWVGNNEVAYRSRIFQHFHGLLTFGSPLEKFATIWPARVPISKEPAFRPGTAWFNVYDPIDPISGVLRSFDNNTAPQCSPQPQNIGYASGPLLLLNHLTYLNGPNNGHSLADAVAEWLLTGSSEWISTPSGPRWFTPDKSRHKRRSAGAWIMWVVAVLLLAILGGMVLPVVWTALKAVLVKAQASIATQRGAANC